MGSLSQEAPGTCSPVARSLPGVPLIQGQGPVREDQLRNVPHGNPWYLEKQKARASLLPFPPKPRATLASARATGLTLGRRLSSQAPRPLVGPVAPEASLGGGLRNHGSSTVAELGSFGSLGWPLILAYLPVPVRHWRVLSLEKRHPAVRSA